jgi:cytoskeletal protein CcmA (bactofilin family)
VDLGARRVIGVDAAPKGPVFSAFLPGPAMSRRASRLRHRAQAVLEESTAMAGIEKASAPRSGAHTVIGSSIVIDGEISGDEDLVIQGTVKGRISLKESLYVESSGVIEADIETANVEVSGQVTGNIAASDKVELKTDCKVVGDIRSPRILIADGAVFKGNVDMDVKEGKGK